MTYFLLLIRATVGFSRKLNNFQKFSLPIGYHGNKLASRHFYATSDIQNHSIFTDLAITDSKILQRITKIILTFCFNNFFEVSKNFFWSKQGYDEHIIMAGISKDPKGTWLNSLSETF